MLDLKNKKVLLAMSGGVDSSVAALLLQEMGAEIIGVYMRLQEAGSLGEERARLVSQKLNIKFMPLNLREKFESEVMQYFLESYQQGLTPNPCVKCNQLMKFGELIKVMEVVGADYFATGHYIKKTETVSANGRTIYHVLRAEDQGKDQSYFLYNLNQRLLAKILFPLGDYQKMKIKEIAAENNLPNIQTESQDICFLQVNGQSIEHNDYLREHVKLKKGDIVDEHGQKIGEHQGLPLYTIGQRRGIEMSGGPYYVVSHDSAKNVLEVTTNQNNPRLYQRVVKVRNLNWLDDITAALPMECQAVIRYRQKESGCRISKDDAGNVIAEFTEPQRAVAAGQSVVFYLNNELLGGGIIA